MRGIDDAVMNGLVELAALRGRSVEDEAKAILADSCRRPVAGPQWLAGLRDRARARTAGRPQTDSADLIRSARDERHAGSSPRDA